jgi:hypothetical protein
VRSLFHTSQAGYKHCIPGWILFDSLVFNLRTLFYFLLLRSIYLYLHLQCLPEEEEGTTNGTLHRDKQHHVCAMDVSLLFR